MIAQLLAEAGIEPAGLDAIAFGAGPGSFTGLRIACGFAQGMAFAHGQPLIPVVTLEALAEDHGGARVLACIDARMGELYLAAYERESTAWRAVLQPMLVKPSALPALSGPWSGVGSGFGAHAQALAGKYDLAEQNPRAFPRARAIARLGATALARGQTVAAEHAAPLYLRDKVALDVVEQAAARAAKVPAA